MRTTIQRKVILEQLHTHTDHPGADTIYSEVRQILPRISLGTVYRNLDVLANKGIIQRLEVGGDHAHFDPNPAIHPHFFCTHCRQVSDLKWKNGTSPAWTEIIDSESLKSVNIDGGTLVLEGVCAECSADDK
ncbi:transcriptional repressor [Marispirochaeta aestuarii]|uniref:Fur family transcriptional regulator n=1 Tax=Marispirochaeta aestuarii TaxID=1963862 RepID=UPI0029C869FF|nr:transcriptional repressor [Marispirochaeta aestuarii]